MATTMRRLLRHLFTERAHVRRSFPPEDLARVEAAIGQGERGHSGEICVAIEAALPLARVWSGITPRQRALEVFGFLRVWDTERNDGVLVYLLLADRDVEIVADRGIHAQVGSEAWEAICKTMEAHYRAGDFARGTEEGVAAISALLARHSPRVAGDSNELSDRPVIL